MPTENAVHTDAPTGTGTPAGAGTPPSTDSPPSADTPPGARPRGRDIRQLISYALVGGSGVLLDLGAFLLLYNVAGLHEQVANVLSTSLGITNNFVLNALFTFGKRDRLLLRYLRFYAVGLTGIALTFVLLAVFSRGLGIDPNLVKAGSLPLVLVFQFVLNRKWSFA
ncbi:GtrA family protein [Streptomyces sp. NPDC006527]|jgi:dolichol-phosphate mannosyltransferase|uniref:GtrA family protein n=1 Tax=Streptomyces sp. NPDC006527 TaxID=3364749 RepID=UPI0036B129B5